MFYFISFRVHQKIKQFILSCNKTASELDLIVLNILASLSNKRILDCLYAGITYIIHCCVNWGVRVHKILKSRPFFFQINLNDYIFAILSYFAQNCIFESKAF